MVSSLWALPNSFDLDAMTTIANSPRTLGGLERQGGLIGPGRGDGDVCVAGKIDDLAGRGSCVGSFEGRGPRGLLV